MIKPNWDLFRAKFNDNPQKNFERFCYLLFCAEFDKKSGIFRYKNQANIETEPIKDGDEVIGWQAKFYDSTLSSHKSELLSTIREAKNNYSNLTKLIFYTNQEWGQKNGKKPQGLVEIEKLAEELNISLEWKMASFFESEFVVIQNQYLSKYFFTNDNSIFDLLKEQKQHTENILNLIDSKITFGEFEIEIDRTCYFDELIKSNQNISILSGDGGVGKTAIVKKLYEKFKDEVLFLVFKATEFELKNINDLFRNFTFYDFINGTENIENKIIVIDSAEKLLDLNNKDPFKEFLSVLIKNRWKIIFTARTNYIDAIRINFCQDGVKIQKINILEIEELEKLSQTYSFLLPEDEKLLMLIKNPFYLNEYLKHYIQTKGLNYANFKANLWVLNIGSKPETEKCFLEIALKRANSGEFYINTNCESTILSELYKSGVLGYENTKYFITHDIYEEWALEKIIESEFNKKTSEIKFFETIGSSLAIRKSFRNWLSDKLLLKNETIKSFIEEVVANKQIAPFWKDEIFVSVLLSDYSSVFFDFFKNELLQDEQKMLKRIAFMLRIACKEPDDDIFKQLGFDTRNMYMLTKPKGKGWDNVIKFVFDNIDSIGMQNIGFIFPIIYDWNSKNHSGDTTKFASLIALQFYQWTFKEKNKYFVKYDKNELFKTISNGSSEIIDELKEIFDMVLKNQWKNHLNPYSEFAEFILVDMEAFGVVKNLPEYVLKLADLFWTYAPKEDEKFYSSHIDVEQYFGLDNSICHRYFPSSAYQTPIYCLLCDNLQETIDFILKFTNKSVEQYAKSGFDETVHKVSVYIDKDTIQEQYVSECLWNIYRGTSSPVSPYILQSIHMALEKYLLAVGKNADSKTLESWLVYLLKNSKSASISSVVASIVLAYSDKTFNMAKILFKTKEFIMQDTKRFIFESKAESLYSIGKDLRKGISEIYYNERLDTCKDRHRKMNLETLFLNYQIFRNECVAEIEAYQRQQELWATLDDYYTKVDSESDKTWQLFLARMDRRKMTTNIEKTDKDYIITFEPELKPELKEFSETSTTKHKEFTKYMALKLWANFKLKNDEKAKEYSQYENNPTLALKEAKDIISQLNSNEDFKLLNSSTPLLVCCVLIRDYLQELDKDEREFCKQLILEATMNSLQPTYLLQISDAIEQAFAMLPVLFDIFPEDRDSIKYILLMGLFKFDYVGGILNKENFNTYSILAINNLAEKYFYDYESLLFGYMTIKPIYDKLQSSGKFHSIQEIFEILYKENENIFENFFENKLKFSDLNFDKLDLFSLEVVFKLIPAKTQNLEHKQIALFIISKFAEILFLDDCKNKLDYFKRYNFLQKYAYFILNLPQNEMQKYLSPFLNKLDKSDTTADLLNQFIYAEDALNKYDNFWFVWISFKKKIFEFCKNGDTDNRVNKIVKSYLFAEVIWKDTAKEWHSFKEKDTKFFRDISTHIGHCSSVLYSVAKILNGIGEIYFDDGLNWLYDILSKENYIDKQLEANTIFYIEQYARKYIYKNSKNIKIKPDIKGKIEKILNVLVENGSVTGYMLRDSII